MNQNLKRLGVLLAALGLVTAMAAPASAALVYDNETTSTSTTSDLLGGETVTELSNSSKYKTLEVQSDNATSGEHFTLRLINNETGRVFYETTQNWTATNSSAGHYKLNLSHAEMFAELERQINEDTTVKAVTIWNESETDEESSTIKFTARNGENNSVVVVSSADVNNSEQFGVKSESTWLGFGDNESYATAEGEREVTNNTTITVIMADSGVASQYTNAYDNASVSSQGYLYTMSAWLEGKPVRTFADSAPSSMSGGLWGEDFDKSSNSYAVFHVSGEGNIDDPTLTYHLGSDLEDQNYVEYTTHGGKGLGYWTEIEQFGHDAAKKGGLA